MRDLRGLITNDEFDQGGWCTDEKRNFIHTLVNITLSKVCVEIGVFKGSSLFSFAEVADFCKHLLQYTVSCLKYLRGKMKQFFLVQNIIRI